MNTPITGLPGVGIARIAHPREILAGNVQLAQYLPGLCVIDGIKSRDPANSPDIDVLRAGLLVGKTSGGKYAPSVIGAITNAVAASATSITLRSATPRRPREDRQHHQLPDGYWPDRLAESRPPRELPGDDV